MKKHTYLQEHHQEDRGSPKNDLKTPELPLEDQGLSLPIHDRASVKERLKEERNREYNLFLQQQAQKRKFRKGRSPIASKCEEVLAARTEDIILEDHQIIRQTHTNTNPPHGPEKQVLSRRDAATLTEEEAKAGRKRAGTPASWSQRRQRSQKAKELRTLDEDVTLYEEDETGFRQKYQQDKVIQVRHQENDKQHNGKRAYVAQDTETSAVPEQKNSDHTGLSDEQRACITRRQAKLQCITSEVEEDFATGLKIGTAEETTVTQTKKEQYKQDLLRQIAEQQTNKMKEKRLELRVAATGATDPEKEPDRIKHLGPAQIDNSGVKVANKIGKDPECVETVHPPSPQSDKPSERTGQSLPPVKVYSTEVKQQPERTASWSGMAVPHALPPLEYYHPNYHNGFPKQMVGMAPCFPPIVPNTYMTPYDPYNGNYFYYGNGNLPLHPIPPKNNSETMLEAQHDGSGDVSPKKLPPLKTSSSNETPPLSTDGLHPDRSEHRKEHALSYQEALRQQIKERKEQNRREKEERERLDAKVEAEIISRSPWGRSGGGAPIKDQNGNLVSDLYQMHRINNENICPVEAETKEEIPDDRNQSPTQQLSSKDKFRKEQKQQIEEKKKKQAEEREKKRILEEKEEQRVAKERARLQQEYEEEQRRLQDAENKKKLRAQAQMRPKTQDMKERHSPRRDNPATPPNTRERGGKRSQRTLEAERELFSPDPTLQRTLTHPVTPKLPSIRSRNSPGSRTPREHLVSGRPNQMLHERTPPPNSGREEVIRELSALRRFLKKEQKKLERQMDQAGSQEDQLYYPHRRLSRLDRQDTSESSRIPVQSAARNYKHNTKNSNHHKYRDLSSGNDCEGQIPEKSSHRQIPEGYSGRKAPQSRRFVEHDPYNDGSPWGRQPQNSPADHQPLLSKPSSHKSSAKNC